MSRRAIATGSIGSFAPGARSCLRSCLGSRRTSCGSLLLVTRRLAGRAVGERALERIESLRDARGTGGEQRGRVVVAPGDPERRHAGGDRHRHVEARVADHRRRGRPSMPVSSIAASSIDGSGLEGWSSEVWTVAKSSRQPCASSSKATPRRDLPVAMPSSVPGSFASRAIVVSRAPAYSGSS